MAFCPNCGKQYEGSPQFCPNCGKPIQSSTASAQAAPVQSVKYCQTCGAPNDPGVSYCQKCGGVTFAPSAPSSISRPLGVTILGVIQILGSLVVIGIGVGLTAFLGPLGIIVLPFAILPLIFALALFSGRNWARILMLIGAVLDILSLVGIIWGIVILWYFTRPRVVAYFKQPK